MARRRRARRSAARQRACKEDWLAFNSAIAPAVASARVCLTGPPPCPSLLQLNDDKHRRLEQILDTTQARQWVLPLLAPFCHRFQLICSTQPLHLTRPPPFATPDSICSTCSAFAATCSSTQRSQSIARWACSGRRQAKGAIQYSSKCAMCCTPSLPRAHAQTAPPLSSSCCAAPPLPQIRITNPTFGRHVRDAPGGEEFMHAAGWTVKVRRRRRRLC